MDKDKNLIELYPCPKCNHYHLEKGLRASLACAIARCVGDIFIE